MSNISKHPKWQLKWLLTNISSILRFPLKFHLRRSPNATIRAVRIVFLNLITAKATAAVASFSVSLKRTSDFQAIC